MSDINPLLQEPKVIESIIKELDKLPDEDSKKRVLDYVNSAFKFKPKVESNTSGLVGSEDETNPIALWKKKDPQTNYEKFALVAYYLEKIKEKEEYSREDIEKPWKDDFKQTLPAKQVITNSLNHTLNTYHYILTGSKKGIYRLGNRGDELVKGLPNPNEKLRGAAKKSKAKSKKKAK